MKPLPRLSELFDDLRGGHSGFQVDNYIVRRAGGTPYGMFKQALRELRVRTQGRSQILLEFAKLRRRERWGFFRTRIQRAHDALLREDMERQLADVERELMRFYDHATRLKDELGDLSPERIEELEAEHWRHKLRVQCAVDLLVNKGELREGSLDLLMSLPKDERAEFLEVLARGDAKHALVEWVTNYEPETAALSEGGRPHALRALTGS